MPPDIASVCATHLAFMKWADSAVLDAAVAQETFYPALVHIYQAERNWLRRVCGEENVQMTDIERPADNRGLAELWPGVHAEWMNVGGDWGRVVPHRNSKGFRFEMPLWQIVLHLVNHGSYHRGQVIMQMRQAGFTPPSTDLIGFFRL